MFVIQSTTIAFADPEPDFEPLPSPMLLGNPALEQSLSMRLAPMETAYPYPAQPSVIDSRPAMPMPCPAMPYDAYADQEDSIPLAYLLGSLASRQYEPNCFEARQPDADCQCPYCVRHRPPAGFLYNGEE